MKKSILSVMMLSAIAAQAQNTPTKTVKPAATKTTTTKTVTTKPAVVNPGPILKTTNDSLNYILGEIAAFSLVQQGLSDIPLNSAIYMRGLNDILGKKQTLLDDVTANAMLNNYVFKKQEEKSKSVIEEGKAFLAQNKTKPGVKTTASGLQYEVVTEGQGIKPTLVDTFVAHYRGTLLDGTQFDASYDRGQPLTYPVAKVIKGWQEGLMLMSVGSKYKFWIPYDLAYGTMGQGQIPGGAMLIFELELLEVKKGQ